MANTIKNVATNVGPNKYTVYMTLASDGSEETDYSLYDSSAVATAAGDTDTLDCTIEWITAYVSAASTARVILEWDATTDVLALNIPANMEMTVDWRNHGGLPNQGASGKTGDINLTTTGLESGDAITIVMGVRRN